MSTVDETALEEKVQRMYRALAIEPRGSEHQHEFISERVRRASATYRVKSVSLLARKER